MTAAVSRRDRILISTCLVVLSALAWTYLFHFERQMSSSMEHGMMMAEMGMAMNMSWTAADGLFTFAMWVVMMVGMMAGAAAPVLLLFAAAHARRAGRGGRLAVMLFGLATSPSGSGSARAPRSPSGRCIKRRCCRRP